MVHKRPNAYCAICARILYPDEISFLRLSVEEYRQTRPFYCSLVAGGDWTEIVTTAIITRRLKEHLITAPKSDDDLNDFLAMLPSAAVPEDDDEEEEIGEAQAEVQAQAGFVKVACCMRHSEYSDKVQIYHDFVRSRLQPGLIVDGVQGILPRLEWTERPFVAPIM
ncbi:hypothetical protein BGX29_005197, partial [Mortierella sp. GBA35]